MGGAYADNQPDYSWIKPYETKRWKQYWYPVKNIEGFKNANLNAAVNLEKRSDHVVFLGFHPTQMYEKAQVVLKKEENIVFQKQVQISPENSFAETIDLGVNFEVTDLYTELINLENNEVLISYQPKIIEKRELPPVVEPPLAPEDISNLEELFLAGKRIEQFYNPRYNELDYYKEVIKRDSGDIRSNTAIGNYYLKRGDYISARSYFSRAIGRLTADYTRPETCEPLYLQGLTLKALELFDEAVDTLYRASWDFACHSAAYFQLAQISCLKGDLEKALNQIDESISSNTKNMRAVALKAAIQRNLGDFEGAKLTLKEKEESDPLNFRITNEKYLAAKESGWENEAEKQLRSLTQKMRNNEQNYLELAVGYVEDGLLNEAAEVLARLENNHPILNYYQGHIQQKMGNSAAAKSFFEKAQNIPVDYCFPYRLQTVPVLRAALKVYPNDGKAWYYLGNILYNKQPEKAVEYWKKAVQFAPGLAVAFRNLGWAYYRYYNNYDEAILWYEKAMDLNPDDAIYYSELDHLYELNNSPVANRLALFEGKNEVVKNRDDAFVRQIMVLTLAGQPGKSVEYLQNKRFSYREGNSRVREVIIDAQLSLGLQYFKNKEYEKALEHYLAAQIPDEEAGSARSGNRDIQVNYFIATAYQALGNIQKANEFYVLASNAEGRTSIMSFYKGLSFQQLKMKKEADEVFQSLINEGKKQLKPGSQNNDFFAIFGEREAEKVRQSAAYTLRGLGYKGMGKLKAAKEDLTKAVELSVGNLWANTHLLEL